jgi:hypothetical protein
MGKKMPKKKDRKNIEGDAKGFFYKAKTNSLNSFDGFIKEVKLFNKEDIPTSLQKKVQAILDK